MQARQNIDGKKTKNIRASQIFYSITNEDMNQFFMDYVQEPKLQQFENEIDLQAFDKKQPVEIAHQQQNKLKNYDQTQEIKVQTNKQVVSRLQIQVEKNQLNFVPVYGEIFIMIVKSQLLSNQKNQSGQLLVTNYRLIFFKNKSKKLDLPFGFISQCKFYEKSQQIHSSLKYNHFWKLKISDLNNFNHIKIFLQIYLKIQSIRSSFAFNYAAKFPQIVLYKQIDLNQQFLKLGFKYKDFYQFDNKDFQTTESYPQKLYVPIKIPPNTIQKISKFWNQGRFPCLTYLHKTSNNIEDTTPGIWRSSNLICDRTQNLNQISKFLVSLKRKNLKLFVFDCGFKYGKKGIDEFQVNSQCQVKYLQIQSIQNIRSSYVSLVQSFLIPKKSFFKDVISSKWYDLVLLILKSANQVASRLLNRQNVLVKCYNGRDKSPIISALTQIIINPYYRTFRGFQTLIQKQFQYFGFPFLDRLGLSTKKDQQSPVFILFLDCVAQLFKVNQMAFQFNYKYLGKLSNLMYTCLFGTFITNCQKQRWQNKVDSQTIPIWNELISDLTKNAFYFQKNGILQIPTSYDDIRIWKQHFGYLTTAPKQTYKLHPFAEDNLDYLNLNCQRVIEQNKYIQQEIERQKRTLAQLKLKIRDKESEKNLNETK